jgi:hypothetical protein
MVAPDEVARIGVGDIVLARIKGRSVHGEVTEVTGGVVYFWPLSPAAGWRHASAREIVSHWRKAGRQARSGPSDRNRDRNRDRDRDRNGDRNRDRDTDRETRHDAEADSPPPPARAVVAAARLIPRRAAPARSYLGSGSDERVERTPAMTRRATTG